MKKFLSLLLACAMVFSLAACGETKAPGGSQSGSGSMASGENQSDFAADVNFLPDNATDLAQELLGFANTTALLTVNGQAVSAEKYLYWLGNMAGYYSYLYSMYGMSLDLDEEMEDGSTYGDALKEMAYQNCALLAVTEELAEEMGVALDEEDYADLIAQREADIESAGGEEDYALNLQAMGISDRSYFEMDRVTALYDKIKEKYEADALTALTEAEVLAYAEEQDLLSAKHILILTQDAETGEELDEEAKAEAKAKAEDILAQLKAGGDFDTLMQENSQDTGLASYPDGYTFTAGEMVTEFEEATRALEIGGMSQELVESPYGYHIILRQSPDNDSTRADMAEEKFNDLVQERMDSAEIVKAAEYDTFTAGDYYNALLDYQSALLAENAEAESDGGDTGDDSGELPAEDLDETPAEDAGE